MKVDKLNENLHVVENGDLAVSFVNTYDVCNIDFAGIRVNQLTGNVIDGANTQVYVNYEGTVYSLIGRDSGSNVKVHDNGVVYTGDIKGTGYELYLSLGDNDCIFYTLKCELDVEVIFSQNLILAGAGSSEPYMSQYIDHSVHSTASGYVVCSRQNQRQGCGNPYSQIGSFNHVTEYATDGFDFYGLNYKDTNVADVLTTFKLPNQKYQYEFAQVSIKSSTVNGEVVFYQKLVADYETAVSEIEYQDEIKSSYQALDLTNLILTNVEVNRANNKFNGIIKSVDFTEDELEAMYGELKLCEYVDGSLVSFYTSDYSHIVLKNKELMVERSHGHVLVGGQNYFLNDNIISSTTYMTGVFNSQIVVGNTSMNKLTSNLRNALNVQKTNGQRMYVEIDGEYKLLSIPSVYEIGMNYTKWLYKFNDMTIEVVTYTTSDDNSLVTEFNASQPCKVLVTNQITLNEREYEVEFDVEKSGNIVNFNPTQDTFMKSKYPNIKFAMQLDQDFELVEDSIFTTNGEVNNTGVVSFALNTANFIINTVGDVNGNVEFKEYNFEAEKQLIINYYQDLTCGFELSGVEDEEVEKTNTLMWWYTNNMLTHYLMPHGLEQYGGAAWGTRDVCQGPFEYFMAMKNFDIAKQIILKIFAHQFIEDGNWPQWFMFDKYTNIMASESHGDIIVWPLKTVADYLTASNDLSILDEMVDYVSRDTFDFVNQPQPLRLHLEKEIEYIKKHFIKGTHLSAYDDGDWDDTLQPANKNLKEYMVSGWTVPLTYQAFLSYANAIDDKELQTELYELCLGIKEDYNHYVIKDEVAAGFIYAKDINNIEHMLHPVDQKTGINYRLLPINRGIISQLFTKEQADNHYQILKEHLMCPDGVRLMNRPATYKGGVNEIFQRAETASNFGREVGLQYVHAHIRFVEAMSRLGDVDHTWHGLQVINPILLTNTVKNAEIRQSNCYFSSSDGKFLDRYDAQDNFNKLRDGSVKVKGGWRIYSSGPGIYLNQLVSNVLGIRYEHGNLILDPVIPNKLDGLVIKTKLYGHVVSIKINMSGNKSVTLNGQALSFKDYHNTYRDGGVMIEQSYLEKLLENESMIELSL